MAVLRRKQTAKELNDSQKPANYVVMVTTDSLKVSRNKNDTLLYNLISVLVSLATMLSVMLIMAYQMLELFTAVSLHVTLCLV